LRVPCKIRGGLVTRTYDRRSAPRRTLTEQIIIIEWRFVCGQLKSVRVAANLAFFFFAVSSGASATNRRSSSLCRCGAGAVAYRVLLPLSLLFVRAIPPFIVTLRRSLDELVIGFLFSSSSSSSSSASTSTSAFFLMKGKQK